MRLGMPFAATLTMDNRGMSLFIGHKTAELLLDSPGAASFTPADDVALEHCWASRSDLSAIDLSELMDVPTPYDVLVSRREEKRFWVTQHSKNAFL